MWKVNGPEAPLNGITLEPVQTLYEFDGPKIFTCTDGAGGTFLAYQCAQDRDGMRFLVVPSSTDLVGRLERGEVDVRSALEKPDARLFELGNDWSIRRCWGVNVEEIPPQTLPKPGVLLWANLQPAHSRVSPTPRHLNGVGSPIESPLPAVD